MRRLALFLPALIALATSARASDPDWEARKPTWCCRQEGNISAGTAGIFTGAAMVRPDELELSPVVGTELPGPSIDARPRLDGLGWLAGAGVRGSFQEEHGWRLGGSFGAFELGGSSLLHDPIAPDHRLYLDRAVVLQVAPFVGKAFEGYVVYPYVDVVAIFDVVLAEVITRHDPTAHSSTTRMAALSVDIVPRIGTLIPIDGDWYVDVGIQHGLFGIERIGGYFAVGTWDDF
ncbi:MAG TPA: hypothetical protein VFB62_06735 [Polyangiaceae bacterium]|nr:hypothetical protein [Polyangiaceae bacterium]